jgi:hypothetical protein
LPGTLTEDVRILKDKTQPMQTSQFGQLGILTHPLALMKGFGDVLVNVAVSDIRGQAMDMTLDARIGDQEKAVNAICDELGNQDAALIVVRTPSNEVEFEEERIKLRNSIRFVHKMLTKSSVCTPVVLVFTQVDRHPALEGVGERIHEKLKQFRTQTSSEQLLKYGPSIRSLVINPEFTPVVEDPNIHSLIVHFCIAAKEASQRFPTRAFFTSAYGFEPDDRNSDTRRINPYGTNVALLWTIYAIASANQRSLRSFQQVHVDNLLTDIAHRMRAGGSYFVDENVDGPWDIRSLREPDFHHRYLDADPSRIM